MKNSKKICPLRIKLVSSSGKSKCIDVILAKGIILEDIDSWSKSIDSPINNYRDDDQKGIYDLMQVLSHDGIEELTNLLISFDVDSIEI
jgi:hypothetical protein